MIQRASVNPMAIVVILFAFVSIGFFQYDITAQTPVFKTVTALDSMLYIGHATVKIKTAQKQVIYIDPYQSGNYSDSADVVLITHQHADHNNLSLVMRKKNMHGHYKRRGHSRRHV